VGQIPSWSSENVAVMDMWQNNNKKTIVEIKTQMLDLQDVNM
jgi:hypothetical protein